jgi:hypothetical protein
MTRFVSKITSFVPALFYLRLLLVVVLAGVMGTSCDLPQGWRNGKGSLTIALPGAPVSARGVGVVGGGVHLPVEITNDMVYDIYFSGPGETGFDMLNIRERMVTVDLEPGLWGISVSATHPASSSPAGYAFAEGVNIRAGRENFVPLTMNADEGILPMGNLSSGTKDGYFVATGASITLQLDGISTEPYLAADFAGYFSSGAGIWENNYQYRWYWEDENGNSDPGVPALDNFSIPSGPLSLSLSTTSEGYFTYYVEFANEYKWKGVPVAEPAKNRIKVAVVEVADSTAYDLGDPGPGGGTVFYKGPRFYVNGQPCHYLEVGPDRGTAQWGLYEIYAGADNYGIGAGYANTQIILAALAISGETGRAAQIAAGYNGGSQNDWFLPSVDELDTLYAYSTTLFGSNELWSSNEMSSVYATTIVRNDGGIQGSEKTSNTILHVRPIRAF